MTMSLMMHRARLYGRAILTDPRRFWYAMIVLAVIYMYVHIELQLGVKYAPETVLIRPPNTDAEEQSVCVADITSDAVTIRNKALEPLESIYDVVDPGFFLATNESGYYLLDTGLTKYQGDFEIYIECSPSDSERYSYMVINQDNNRCNIDRNGRVLLC